MKKLIPVAIAIVLIIAVGYFWLMPELKHKVTYSNVPADLNEYYSIYADTDVAIMLGDKLLKSKAHYFDGHLYVDRKVCEAYFTDRLYYSEAENVLLYTDATQVYTVYAKDKTKNTSYFIGEEKHDLGHEIVLFREDTMYLSMEYLRLFSNYSCEFFENPYRIQLDIRWETKQVATLSHDTMIRTLAGTKCPVMREVKKGETVTVLEKMETWCKVKTGDAMIGYVENKYLSDEKSYTPTPVNDALSTNFPNQCRDYTVALGWHYMGSSSQNDKVATVISSSPGMNVISPTWFFLKGDKGGFVDLGSAQYVKTAHSKGLEVWALIEDISYKVDLTSLLATREKRATLIDNIMDAVSKYDLDGINIDFESVKSENGPEFVQFIRELSLKTRAAGVVLSVDVYVPNLGNTYYDYDELGRVADYVIMMGYDEHWAGCSEAGSVASIGFVKDGIVSLLGKEIPAYKIINAVPFYSRVWESRGGSITDTTDSMVNLAKWAKNKGMTLEWDDETAQNYGELVSGNTTYYLWMEDAQSIQAKLNMMLNYHIAGVAGWRLGFESADVWPLISAYVDANSIEK